MEILSNFNSIEVIFILILVLILFGPERLPEIAGRIGSTLGKLKSTSSQIMAEWRREAGLEEISQEGRQLSETVDQSLQEARKSIRPDRAPSTRRTTPAENSERQSGKQPEASGADQRARLTSRLEELETELQHLRGQLNQMEPQPDQGEDQDG
jgi:sec-independent protein translocase protein TatB